MSELTRQQKKYEATLEEFYADLINSNCPIDKGISKKICHYFQKNSEPCTEEDVVAVGFPYFLVEVEDFVSSHYADCIEEKHLEISEDNFALYVAWKTIQNKLFVSVFDKEKDKKKTEPREKPLIYSSNDSVKQLVDMATAKKNMYKATGKTKQIQLSLVEQVELATKGLKEKFDIVVDSLLPRFRLGVISEHQFKEELAKSNEKIVSNCCLDICKTIVSQHQEKINEIQVQLPMFNNKQLNATKEEK